MYSKGVQKMATRLDGTTYPAENTSATSASTTITGGDRIGLSLFSHDDDDDVEEEVLMCCVCVCLCFSHKDGYEKFSDWKKLWTGNGKSEPSLKAFMADQQLPYWVRRVFLLRLMRALVENTAKFFIYLFFYSL